MIKMLVFDMDGTIADLYRDPNWLDRLHAGDETLYADAAPIYDMEFLNAVLALFKNKGWKITVTSWLAGESTPDFDERVAQAKQEWLDSYRFPYDEVNFISYGTEKSDCTEEEGGFQILVDDNEDVRDSWRLGSTVDATKDIIDQLLQILADDFR